jgi:hypothetical protein
MNNLNKSMKSTTLTLTVITTALITGTTTSIKPAQASFGDFMLGVGAAVGTGAIIRSNQRAREERYRPVSPQQEFYRGRQDGINGLKYDNPRDSSDYDRGYQEGLKLRRGQ